MPPVEFVGSRLPAVREALKALYEFAYGYGLSDGMQSGLIIGAVLGATAVGALAIVHHFCYRSAARP